MLLWQLNDTLICYSECAYLYTQTWFFVPPIAFYIAEIFSNKCFFSPFYFRLLSGRLTKGDTQAREINTNNPSTPKVVEPSECQNGGDCGHALSDLLQRAEIQEGA